MTGLNFERKFIICFEWGDPHQKWGIHCCFVLVCRDIIKICECIGPVKSTRAKTCKWCFWIMRGVPADCVFLSLINSLKFAYYLKRNLETISQYSNHLVSLIKQQISFFPIQKKKIQITDQNALKQLDFRFLYQYLQKQIVVFLDFLNRNSHQRNDKFDNFN